MVLMERTHSVMFDSVFQYGPVISENLNIRRSMYKSAFRYSTIPESFENGFEKRSEENFLLVALRKFLIILLYLLVIVSFPISFWICLKRVHALERIVLMRLGKLQPIRGPGFAFVLPIVDTWTRVDLKPHNFTVSTPKILTADGAIIKAQTDIEYRVSDVLSYVMKLHKQDHSLRELGSCCVSNVASEKDQEDLEAKSEIISRQIKDELNRSAINWGLEIVTVYLHSVKVIKAAEPVSAIDTIVTALKAATGQSSQHTAAMFPLIPHLAAQAGSETKQHPTLTEENETKDCVDAIRRIAAIKEKEGVMANLEATFQFEVVGLQTRLVMVSFSQGKITVIEATDKSPKSDVQVQLSENLLNDFLSGKRDPTQAYMDGELTTHGDWSLLRYLSKLF